MSTALFTEAEARAFNDSALADESKYSDAAITAAEARIREEFERICGVAFVLATATSERHDGSGTDRIRLDHRRPGTPTAVSVNSVAFTAGELADLWAKPNGLLIRREYGEWYAGSGNVLITYSHGFSTCPAAITRVALIMCLAEVKPTELLASRATSYSDGTQTFQLTYAGPAPHWTGIPEVDATLDRYRRKVAIA